MGRKRSEQCRLAILDATSQIIREKGYLGLTVEEVASRASAGKQTIYRHWGGKQKLALDAFAHEADKAVDPPDTGSLHGDLVGYLTDMFERMDVAHKRRMLAGLLAEVQADAAFGAAFREIVLRAQHRRLHTALQRGIARGEVRPDADLEALSDLVFGPVWYRLLIRDAPLDEAFAEELARAVTAAA